MRTSIIGPSENLRPFVHHYWVMQTEGWGMTMNIMPVGCMKWMFHRRRPLIVNGIVDTSMVATVCGCNSRATHVQSDGATHLLFVFFQPYVSKMVMGMPCESFFDDNVDMEVLDDSGFKLLKRQVLESVSDAEAIRYIENFLIQQLSMHYDAFLHRRLSAVYHTMLHHPCIDVERLADVACLSNRQFRRVFSDNAGIAPKRLQRIHRFYRATQMMLHMDSNDFSPIIYKLGYTDHSHFNKEFHQIAGMSPSEYMKHIEQLRQHYVLDGYQSYHL